MDELVTTGDLEQSIDGDSNDVEAMIADLKGQIASGKIKTPEEIEQAIEKLADKYDLKLSDDDKQKLLGLMKKLQGLDLNWDSIKNQASAWAYPAAGQTGTGRANCRLPPRACVLRLRDAWPRKTYSETADAALAGPASARNGLSSGTEGVRWRRRAAGAD